VLEFSVPSGHVYSRVSNKLYMYKVNTISHRILWTIHYYLLCQRTTIATCSRRIPYYVYHTCQPRSYVIKTDKRRRPCF